MPRNAGRMALNDQLQQRAELESVLASGMFRRAPTLCQILSYVCERYFAGEAAKIKEYNIAVEALGRNGAVFDSSADTIVRVEASRLRKRLRDYYASEGAGHQIHIVLSKSGYIPQFVFAQDDPALGHDGDSPPELMETIEESPPQDAAPDETVPERPPGFHARTRLFLGGGLALLCLGTLVAIAVFHARPPRVAADVSAFSAAVPSTVVDRSAEEGVWILAGYTRPKFIDGLGRPWSGDRYYSGGTISESMGEDILGVLDPTLYRTARVGTFRYDIPLKPGLYELHLLFVETFYGKGNRLYTGEGSRLFHVSVNGVRRLSFLDILCHAGGPNLPADKVLKDISPAADGFLHLAFSPTVSEASLSGIEILPSKPGRIRPVRIVAGGRSYYDRSGRFWGADRYFIGGRPLTRQTVVQGTSDPELYSNERWGHFTYSIPVAPEGRYKVTLKFAETNFGSSNPGRGGVGSRIFDVYCNGVALLRNFDIFKEAGRENVAVDHVFPGLTPNGQGRLVLSFEPLSEYATVRAIEVEDETP